MRRAVLLAAVATALPAALSGSSLAASAQLSCGLPDAQPTWIDFADSYVPFWRERFGQPGVVIATGGPLLAAEARERGAATVQWDMYLRRRVGTPSEPAEPELMERRADSLFEYAVSVTACQQPLIALNELWGASLPTPLTPTAEQYRENVLRFVSRLAERGARPALLVSSEPFTGADAAAWWRSLGQVSDLVLEKYANANVVWREGVVEGSRRLRTSYRRSVASLLAVGVPASRIGLIVGFQTGSGVGGREGLRPRSRWFEVAKWQAFAAKRVGKELRLPHIWSWGWAQRDARSRDPDKTYAACVWLWARDPALCDAPEILGRELDPDRTAGQIDLPAGTRCVYGHAPITASSIAAVARVTGDAELALTALVVRAVARERAEISTSEVLAAERRIVAARFAGSLRAYRRALVEAGASRPVARGIIGDEVRRLALERRLAVARPTSADVARFRATHASVLARRVAVSPSPSWLPEGSGLVLATSAPPSVFEPAPGRTLTVRTAEGVFSVRTLDVPEALAAVPGELARPAIVRELRRERRAAAWAEWTLRAQKAAGTRLACERDRLPELGVVALSSFVPFLSVSEPEAARWAAARRRGRSR